MKNLLIVLLAIFISSCCSTKRVAENAPVKEQQEIAEVITPETPAQPETPEIPETIEVIEPEENPIESEEAIETQEPAEIIETQSTETIAASTEVFNHDTWNTILQNNVSEAGNVNYNSIKSNRKALTNYIASLGENMPNDSWTKEDKLAYWINAYNAMTIDLIVRNLPINSIKDIKEPWDQRLWKLGNKWYNLNQIEHQILRKMDEPRIHFGIVCASFSCPKLQNKAFSASNLDDLLTSATKEFLSDSKRNTISENSVKLSKIFKWFAKDFKENGTLIDFINQYSDVNVSSNAKKSFKEYNWDLND